MSSRATTASAMSSSSDTANAVSATFSASVQATPVDSTISSAMSVSPVLSGVSARTEVKEVLVCEEGFLVAILTGLNKSSEPSTVCSGGSAGSGSGASNSLYSSLGAIEGGKVVGDCRSLG